jgi:hypothetical protein
MIKLTNVKEKYVEFITVLFNIFNMRMMQLLKDQEILWSSMLENNIR